MRWNRYLRLSLLSLLLLGAFPLWAQEGGAAPRSVAFYYGSHIPWQQLRGFDWAVVEPDNVEHLPPPAQQPKRLFAYVSLGEAGSNRPYLQDIPQRWRHGINQAWGSAIIDQSWPEWPRYFAERVIAPLWKQGYRHFFVDTLDSYRLWATTPQQQAEQQAGQVQVLRYLHAHFPGIGLMLNRGFEILPQVHGMVEGVAAESLFRGWDQANSRYVEVAQSDRQWLLKHLQQIRSEYALPVVVIDYLPPKARAQAREVAAKIKADGFIPWVSNARLDMLGVGAEELMPRRVLVLYSGNRSVYDLNDSGAVRFISMPLEYLGYVPELLNVAGPLPDYPLTGRYAGVVLWLQGEVPNSARLRDWLLQQVHAGVRIAVFNDFGFDLDQDARRTLGLAVGHEKSRMPLQLSIVQQDNALMGFETGVMPSREDFRPLRLVRGTPLLRLRSGDGGEMDAAALTPWGGYVLSPYVIQEWPVAKGTRWVVQPIDFLTQALELPAMPVPDVTTENGRRLLMVHTDGDGFASRSAFPGAPFSGEVLYKKIYSRYRIPTTVSVIEGEVGPDGLYPKLSPELETIARRIFSLPNVELASHSYSHPFYWHQAEESASDEGKVDDDLKEFYLPIPGYHFNLNKEIFGSIGYINSQLAPPGKRVKVFLWTGNCNPGVDALKDIDKAHVVALNGGDTLITRRNPSLTLVAPLGVQKDGEFQYFAPNQNENVYTNLWTGPFYGYRQAIETFELTDRPYRLKPMDIYFHFYSGTKLASLHALQQVYDYALAQSVYPIYVSEYVPKVADFNRALVMRSASGWRMVGGKALREWRIPVSLGKPALDKSEGIIGFKRHEGVRYLHLSAPTGTLRLGKGAQGPYLRDANGRITQATMGAHSLSFTLQPHVAGEFTLYLPGRCVVSTEGKRLEGRALGQGLFRFHMKDATTRSIQAHCPAPGHA